MTLKFSIDEKHVESSPMTVESHDIMSKISYSIVSIVATVVA